MTKIRFIALLPCLSTVVLTLALQAQTAESLKAIKSVYVGSLGANDGAEELKRDLARYLDRSHDFAVVASPAQADAVIDGRGELWIRGYHSMSPRARVNKAYDEPVYDGYLSVKVHGKGDEILWSYFADPRRISFRDLKHDLIAEVVGHLKEDRELEAAASAPVAAVIDSPAVLQGAGATFPSPTYHDWFNSFHNKHPAWRFDYAAVGSDAGITKLESKGVDFAGTDIPPAELGNRIPSNSSYFPTVGGAVVMIYNLPGFTGELRLTPSLIADIFSGTIRSWNDSGLRAVNPGVPLPAAPIVVFYRSDGSGTTYAFSEYLSKVNQKWKAARGTGANLKWTSGRGASGNEALAQSVAATPFSIGYAEFIYAFNYHLSFASVLNTSGRFVQADLLSIMAAANGAGEKEQYLSLSITNSTAANAYPISTFSWLIVPSGLEPGKETALRTFIEWMLTSGQRQCSALGYAPLPKNLVDRELSAIRKLK